MTQQRALAFVVVSLAGLVITALGCCAKEEGAVEAPTPAPSVVSGDPAADDAGRPAPVLSAAGPVRLEPGPPPRPSEPAVAAMSTADWDDAWTRALAASAARYEKLALWCVEKRLGITAIGVHRLVLRYLPDDAAARADTGDVRDAAGRWVRDEVRRTAIGGMSDVEDPPSQKYPEQRRRTDKQVVTLWKALAQQAKKSAEADRARAADWTARALQAWARVLEADSASEETHKALGHPKFAGRYVRPEALPFLSARLERRVGGQRRAGLDFPVEPAALGGAFAAAGLTGVGARSAHCVVNTVHGRDVASRLCVWAERAAADVDAVYGLGSGPGAPVPPAKFNIVKDKAELKLLLTSDGLTEAEAVRFANLWSRGRVPSGEATTVSSGGADADDFVIHYTGYGLADALRAEAIRERGLRGEPAEDWLREAIAHDVTRRLTGTSLAVVPCPFEKRSRWEIEPDPAQDLWIELAKRLVEADDDIPLSRLWKLSTFNRDLDRDAVVKGWALLQFLFEWDAAKARAFVRTALARGTPAAVEAVYGLPIDEIDARYREWLRVSW